MSGFFGKEKAVGKVVLVDIQEIVPNPSQPRIYFAEDDLEELAWSIRQNGLLQPLTVRKNKFGQYELISGERRLRAGKMAGLEQIPCIIVETDERQSAIFALIENIQRADLNFFEEAQAIKNLISEWGVTQEEASEKLGKAQSTVANKLRLLRLEEPEQRVILKNGLTERHARALLKIEDAELRMQALEQIVEKKMNVTQTEEYIRRLLEPPKGHQKRIVLIKDVRLFLNTINRALDTMKQAGIPAEAQKKQDERYIEYVVRIPIQHASRAGSGDQIRMGEYLSHGAPFRSR